MHETSPVVLSQRSSISSVSSLLHFRDGCLINLPLTRHQRNETRLPAHSEARERMNTNTSARAVVQRLQISQLQVISCAYHTKRISHTIRVLEKTPTSELETELQFRVVLNFWYRTLFVLSRVRISYLFQVQHKLWLKSDEKVTGKVEITGRVLTLLPPAS